MYRFPNVTALGQNHRALEKIQIFKTFYDPGQGTVATTLACATGKQRKWSAT